MQHQNASQPKILKKYLKGHCGRILNLIQDFQPISLPQLRLRAGTTPYYLRTRLEHLIQTGAIAKQIPELSIGHKNQHFITPEQYPKEKAKRCNRIVNLIQEFQPISFPQLQIRAGITPYYLTTYLKHLIQTGAIAKQTPEFSIGRKNQHFIIPGGYFKPNSLLNQCVTKISDIVRQHQPINKCRIQKYLHHARHNSTLFKASLAEAEKQNLITPIQHKASTFYCLPNSGITLKDILATKPNIKNLVDAVARHQPVSAKKLSQILGLKCHHSFVITTLRTAVKHGLIEPTNPATVNGRTYRLPTKEGQIAVQKAREAKPTSERVLEIVAEHQPVSFQKIKRLLGHYPKHALETLREKNCWSEARKSTSNIFTACPLSNPGTRKPRP